MQILAYLIVSMCLLWLFTASNSQMNQTTNPQLNQTTNPQLNQTTNPQLNQTINPQLNDTSDSTTCADLDIVRNPHGICKPCEMHKWFELILNQRADTYVETTCFNNYPLGTNLPSPCPKDLTKGKDYPELDLSKTPRGFIISKLPFFRYNAKLPTTVACSSSEVGSQCPSNCTSPTTDDSNNSTEPNVEENLDVGDVKHYYVNKDESMDPYSVDLQVLEWAGRQSSDQKQFLEQKLNRECEDKRFQAFKSYLCGITEKGSRHFQILKLERESSKLLHYPCNNEEGTSIVALGLMARYEEEESDENPQSKLYLSYVNQSIFNAPGYPLYVSEAVLNLMARSGDSQPKGVCRKASEEPKNCDFTKDLVDPLPIGASDCDWRQKYFKDRGDVLIHKENCNPFQNSTDCSKCKVSKALTGDLRTILDFTFVQGRLLLGMRCGILVVKSFLERQLDIRPASLISSNGEHKNAFPPINKIASNFCCKTFGCKKTIVAAYSSYENRPIEASKELYISFDLGETFYVKLMLEPTSALNLMWGMYKLYGDWLLYYQLLEEPDAEDLRDERGQELHPGYVDLRTVPDWDSLTLAKKEQRFLYGETVSQVHIRDVEVRKRALRRFVKLRTAGALGRFVRYRRLGKEINLDLAPGWLQEEVRNFRKHAPVTWEENWTDSNCDSNPICRSHFENDHAVQYFLKESGVVVKTPKKSVEESFCDQIMSMVVLPEENSLYVICRVGFGDFSQPFESNTSDNPSSCSSRQTDVEKQAKPNCTFPLSSTITKAGHHNEPKQFPYNECVNSVKFYAVYSLSVNEKLPFVLVNERRSERLFTCKHMETYMDWYGCKSIDVFPELLHLPKSVSLLIKNCNEVLYYSPNGGKNLFNTQFYATQDQFPGFSTRVKNCEQSANCKESLTNSTSNKRQMMYRIKALRVASLIAIAPSSDAVFMTMRNTYAYGLLGINREFRMVVGDIFPNIETSIISKVRSNDFVFPDFSDSGQPLFAVALKLIYGHNKKISCKLYANRHGMRLVHMEFFFYKDVSYFYEENKDLDSEARASGLIAPPCHTYQFSAKPDNILLDVDETGVVEVSVYDPQPNIALGLVSSEEKSIIVDVSFVDRNRKEKEHLAHDWDIHVRAIRNHKPRITAHIHSFFGAENNNMFGFHTEVGLANNFEFRCHVQPAATVAIEIGCQHKKLVVHEEEYRPQCLMGTFSKSAFEYRLKKGTFDPNLAGYWIDLDQKEGKNSIKLERETGDLVIVYDYLRFGCPLEPYRDNHFIPDLRIATADTQYNSSLGTQYNGSFLLIELFGAKGFTFSKTYEDYGCMYVPMNITNAIEDWVTRQRIFRIAYSRQRSVSDFKSIKNALSQEELDALEIGNRLFIPDAVDQPINIVNRVTYRDCMKWRSFFIESENSSAQLLKDLSPEEQKRHLEQPLQVMWRGDEDTDDDYDINTIDWEKNNQQVYIFMAVALDPTESLCEYYTIFGVHLPELSLVSSYITLFVFLFLVILWILIFACGYMCRKSRIRTLCIELERKRRLEEAAWKVVYQYERLLQENENWKFEEEFQEISETIDSDSEKQWGSSKDKIKTICKHKPKCKNICGQEPKCNQKPKCKPKRGKRAKEDEGI